MQREFWNRLRIQNVDESLWETFHENSKFSKFEVYPTNTEAREIMDDLWPAMPYSGFPIIDLPSERAPLDSPLETLLEKRVTARKLGPKTLDLSQLTSLLFAAYGETRSNDDGSFGRPFRTIPSAGAMYPLELFFFTHKVKDLKTGLYHYNPHEHHLRLMSEENLTGPIAEALAQPNVALDSSVIFLISAIFARETMKYGDRGYRFAFLEAGHLGQNLDLASASLGLGSMSIGGFCDRDIDKLLNIDGIMHSVIYMKAVGELIDSTTPIDFETGD